MLSHNGTYGSGYHKSKSREREIQTQLPQTLNLLNPQILDKSPISQEGKITLIDILKGKPTSSPGHKSRGSNLSVPHLEPVFAKKISHPVSKPIELEPTKASRKVYSEKTSEMKLGP